MNDTLSARQVAEIIAQLADAAERGGELTDRLLALTRRAVTELTSPPTPQEIEALSELAEKAHSAAAVAAQMN